MFVTLFQLAMKHLLFFALHVERGSFPKQLSKAEERECLEKIAEGCAASRNKLIEHNLRLVAHIVKQRYGNSKDQDDLISIGIVGLISAVESFKLERNSSFSTYASTCINNQIKMHFRKASREPEPLPLDATTESENDGSEITWKDRLSGDDNTEEEAELRIKLQMLYKYIGGLDERERNVICLRYGLARLGGKFEIDKEMTQDETAGCLNISRSYVSRIEKKAIDKLRIDFDVKNQ